MKAAILYDYGQSLSVEEVELDPAQGPRGPRSGGRGGHLSQRPALHARPPADPAPRSPRPRGGRDGPRRGRGRDPGSAGRPGDPHLCPQLRSVSLLHDGQGKPLRRARGHRPRHVRRHHPTPQGWPAPGPHGQGGLLRPGDRCARVRLHPRRRRPTADARSPHRLFRDHGAWAQPSSQPASDRAAPSQWWAPGALASTSSRAPGSWAPPRSLPWTFRRASWSSPPCSAPPTPSTPTVQDPVERVRQITNGLGADYAFEVFGSSETVEVAFEAARKGGDVVVVGLAPVGETARISASGPGPPRRRPSRAATTAAYGPMWTCPRWWICTAPGRSTSTIW